jgi:hypothetical protein
LLAAQQHLQTFLFHWRMKAPDHRDTSLTQREGQIIGAQNDTARAAGGTEKAQQWHGQNVEIAQGP